MASLNLEFLAINRVKELFISKSTYGSSSPEFLYRKAFGKFLKNPQENTFAKTFFFNKVAENRLECQNDPFSSSISLYFNAFQYSAIFLSFS